MCYDGKTEKQEKNLLLFSALKRQANNGKRTADRQLMWFLKHPEWEIAGCVPPPHGAALPFKNRMCSYPQTINPFLPDIYLVSIYGGFLYFFTAVGCVTAGKNAAHIGRGSR